MVLEVQLVSMRKIEAHNIRSRTRGETVPRTYIERHVMKTEEIL